MAPLPLISHSTCAVVPSGPWPVERMIRSPSQSRPAVYALVPFGQRSFRLLRISTEYQACSCGANRFAGSPGSLLLPGMSGSCGGDAFDADTNVAGNVFVPAVITMFL